MPNYKVQVKVIEERVYEVDVEASNFAKAEDVAAGKYLTTEVTPLLMRRRFETDSEQTSWECEGCARSITDAQDTANCGMCDDCAKQHEEVAA